MWIKVTRVGTEEVNSFWYWNLDFILKVNWDHWSREVTHQNLILHRSFWQDWGGGLERTRSKECSNHIGEIKWESEEISCKIYAELKCAEYGILTHNKKEVKRDWEVKCKFSSSWLPSWGQKSKGLVKCTDHKAEHWFYYLLGCVTLGKLLRLLFYQIWIVITS